MFWLNNRFFLIIKNPHPKFFFIKSTHYDTPLNTFFISKKKGSFVSKQITKINT